MIIIHSNKLLKKTKKKQICVIEMTVQHSKQLVISCAADFDMLIIQNNVTDGSF